MTDTEAATEAALSRAIRLDAACDQFELEWKAGQNPQVDQYVAAAQESDRDSIRVALQSIERELCQRSITATTDTRSGGATPALQFPDATVLHRSDKDTLPTAIGRFEVRGVLGTGAFGKVYLAFDPQLGREVAIKVPIAPITASSDEKQRFLKEARAAATINHPNVCHIHEVGEHLGRPYIVMPFTRGASLADTLKNRKQLLDARQVAQVVRKIALALAAAHAKGIIHRDLKPANVMFDRERKDILVMDFGLARGPQLGTAGATQSGVVMGTPAYMSPEQARGDTKTVGPASDIYSLGVILYELLTGTRPFNGTATEVIGQILHVEPETPSMRNPGTDPNLEAACLKAMAKNPAERFSSMKEFAAAIDAGLKQPVDHGSPAETTARAQQTRGENINGGSANMSDLFAVLSAERKSQQVATAAAVDAALRRSRTPPWVFIAIALVLLGGFVALGIIFSFRDDKVRVTVELSDVDLTDQTLSFLLDELPISAEALSKEIELSPGAHVLVVKRGEQVVKRMLLTVTGGQQRGIKVKDITPPPIEPEPPEQPAKVVWQPLIQSADELVAGETFSAPNSDQAVRFRDGRLDLRGANASFHPKFTAKNYILRAKILEFSGKNVMFSVRRKQGEFAGYGAYFNNHDPALDWPAYGLGKSKPGTPWKDIQGTMQRVSYSFPVDFALSAFGDQLSIYVDGECVLQCTDRDCAEGGVRISLTGDSRAVLSDLEVCVLDDTTLKPEDVFRPQAKEESRLPLLPEYLTAERKKGNMLRDGSFEDAHLSAWKMESWRSLKESCSIIADPGKHGSRVLQIKNKLSDDVSYKHTAKVKPLTRYLLSGWIKTKDVGYKSNSRTIHGAHLYVWGGHERKTSSLTVTNDWTYCAVIFQSGNRTSVEIAARLGYFAGDVTGTAWFDDLCLVEIPEPGK